MKKLFLPFFSIITLLTLLSSTTFAQNSQGTVVATVNISNAKIVLSNDRDYKISFDISNRVGAQPQIKYSVRLTKVISNTEPLVDEKVYEETLSLAENTKITKVIDYTIPPSISIGTYRMWIDSKNENGLPLGVAFVGEVNITKSISNTTEIIPNTCYLIVGTSTTRYLLDQGVSISLSDELALKCKIQSNLSTNTIFIPNFITRSHTLYGEIVSDTGGSRENITIKKGINDINITLPKASNPQSYNISFFLKTPDSKTTSNTISVSYILSGVAGEIKNVVFDKTYYRRGDTANLQVFSTQTGVDTSTITASIIDETGLCSETTTKDISNFSIIDLKIPITKDCTNPKANIILSSNGTILDTQNYEVMTVVSTTTPTFSTTTIYTIIVAIILLVIILIITEGYYRNRISKLNLLIIIFLFSMSFAGSVKAAPPIINISAASSTVAYGASTNISFNTNQSTSCTLTGNGKTTAYSGVFRYSFQTGGSFGGGNGQFWFSSDISNDSLGNIYVTDIYRDYAGGVDVPRLQKLDSFGQYVSKFGSFGSGNGQFYYPTGIVADSSDNIYVVDTGNNRILKFSSSGQYVSQFGSSGSGNGQFSSPRDIGIDSFGNIYIADTDNNRILKFSSSGQYVSQFGSSGSGIAQFSSPFAIAVDSSDNIYVADRLNHRIQKFDSTGNYILQFGSYGTGDGQFYYPIGIGIDSLDNVYVSGVNNVQKFTSSGEYISKFFSGNSISFGSELPISIDFFDNVYILDKNNFRVQKFSQNISGSVSSGPLTSDTTFSMSCTGDDGTATNQVVVSVIPQTCTSFTYSDWGVCSNNQQTRSITAALPNNCSGGSPVLSQHCSSPLMVNIDASSTVVLTGSSTTVSWSSAGANSCLITKNGSPLVTSASGYEYFSQFNTFLDVYGFHGGDKGIARDSLGNIYVLDTKNVKIKKFDSSGAFISQFGEYGSDIDGYFMSMIGMAIDSSDNIYILDSTDGRVQKFDSSGRFISKFYSIGNGVGRPFPTAITIDSSDNIYVAYRYNGYDYNGNYDIKNESASIQKFDSSGRFISKFGSLGSGDGKFYYVISMTTDSTGKVYVLDYSNWVQKFTSSGTFISKSGSYGDGNGQFYVPASITTDAYDNLYVVESGSGEINNRVQKFTSSGVYVSQFGSYGSGDGQFKAPIAAIVDSSNSIYVVDSGNDRIQKFSQSMTVSSLSGSRSSGPITSPTTFAATCMYNTNSKTDSVLVDLAAFPINIQFTAASSSILSGNSTTLSWTSTGADSCEIVENLGDVNRILSTATSGTNINTGNLNEASTFTATCMNTENSRSELVIINVYNETPTVVTTPIVHRSCGGSSCQCVGYDYSDWLPSVCPAEGFRTRTLVGNLPQGCSGEPSETLSLTQNCIPGEVACIAFLYDDWFPSACSVGSTQTRNVIEASPLGCTLGESPITTRICPVQPEPASICTVTQTGNEPGDNNIYLNRNTIWKITNTAGDPQSTLWIGTNLLKNRTSGDTLNKIYTTVGQKMINAFTTVIRPDGTLFSSDCSATTTVRLDTGTSGEI